MSNIKCISSLSDFRRLISECKIKYQSKLKNGKVVTNMAGGGGGRGYVKPNPTQPGDLMGT